MANEIIPLQMQEPLQGIRRLTERIGCTLTRHDIRTVHEPLRADNLILRALVEELDRAVETVKDSPNGTGPVRDGPNVITANG